MSALTREGVSLKAKLLRENSYTLNYFSPRPIQTPELLSHILSHLPNSSLANCLRVSQLWFDIAGDHLYRVLDVNFQHIHHPLTGLQDRNRVGKQGDVLPEGKSLKRILVEKCRNITIRQHFHRDCKAFAKIKSLSIPVIRYLQNTSDRQDRNAWDYPGSMCDRDKRIDNSYSEGPCPLIKKLERPTSVIITYPHNYPAYIWTHLDGRLHRHSLALPSDIVNYTAVLPRWLAIPKVSPIFDLGLGGIASSRRTAWTFVFWTRPEQSWLPSFAELRPMRATNTTWIKQFCYGIASLYFPSSHCSQSTLDSKMSSTLTLCNLENVYPEDKAMQLYCPGKDLDRGEFLAYLKDMIEQTIQTLKKDRRNQHSDQAEVEMTPIAYCSMEDFVSRGNWKDALTSKQAASWLDHVRKKKEKANGA